MVGIPPGGGLIFPTDPRHAGGQDGVVSGRRGCSARKFVSGNFARLYRSKYQLFNFSEGNNRAKASAVWDSNCT